jgi:RNA polymerase sigma factor (TIGR02999 family)
MRRVIVDRARALRAEKRGEHPHRVDLLDGMMFTEHNIDEILSVDQALAKLSTDRPREAFLVELRYFAGFSMGEAASALHVSERTARRDWEEARMYLKDAIDGTASSGQPA